MERKQMSGKLTALRLLLVEDDPTDADLLRRSLQRSSIVRARFELEAVDPARDAATRLRHNGYDAVLLDLNLPDAPGLDTLALVQEAAGETPIIVGTRYDHQSLGLQTLP